MPLASFWRIKVEQVKMPPQSIQAEFRPQARIKGHATDIDGEQNLDVTERVLGLKLSKIHALRDASYVAQGLVDAESLGHRGPYRVLVADSVRAFFGVEDLSDITENMLLAAREATQRPPRARHDHLLYGAAAVRKFHMHLDCFLDEDAVGATYGIFRENSELTMKRLTFEEIHRVARCAADSPEQRSGYEMVVIDSGNKHGDSWKAVFYPDLKALTFLRESDF
jgi:hypothetical protein